MSEITIILVMLSNVIKINNQQATDLLKTKYWESLSYKQIVLFQLSHAYLCVPKEVFRNAYFQLTGRKFSDQGFVLFDMKSEILGNEDMPEYSDILEVLPDYAKAILQRNLNDH